MLAWASPAFALTCNAIYEAERLEARLALLVSGLTTAEVEQAIQGTLSDLYAVADELAATPFKGTDLIETVGTYTADIAILRARGDQNGGVATAIALRGPRHLSILRRMVGISFDACALETGAQTRPAETQTDNKNPGKSALSLLTEPPGSIIALMIVMGLGVGGYFMGKRMSRNEQKRLRYVCSYDTVISFGTTHRDTTLLDISSMGTKLKRPQDFEDTGKVFVKIGSRTVKAKVAWQNAHFVGLLFTRSISMRRIKQVSAAKEIANPSAPLTTA